MRVVRLAQLLESKYGLSAVAATVPPPQVVEAVKKEIKNAYDLYVNEKTAKEPAFQMLAGANEPYSKALYTSMTNFIKEIDTISPLKIFNRANKIANAVYTMANNHEAAVRQSIHKSVRTRTEPEVNYREHVKSKFGMALFRLSSLLVNAATLLKQTMGLDVKVAPKIEEPPIKELSRDTILRFLKTPDSTKYGLDSEEIMQKALEKWPNRKLITQLINAISRGHIPKVGPDVKRLTDQIKAEMALKQTNTGEFDKPDQYETPDNMLKFDDHEEPEHVIEGDPSYADPSVLDPTEITRKQEQVKKEDEEKANRQKTWETDMLSKYNSASLQRFLRKVKQ